MLTRQLATGIAAPDEHVHTERDTESGDDPADLAVTPNSQSLAVKHFAQAMVGRRVRAFQGALLPHAVFQIGDTLWDTPHRGHDQRPGQFGGRDRRADPFGHGDAACSTRGQVDVRPGPARLRDQAQVRQLREQILADAGTLANEDEGLCIPNAYRELPRTLDRVVEYLDLVPRQQVKAREFAHRVLIVIENRDFHGVTRRSETRRAGVMFRTATQDTLQYDIWRWIDTPSVG